MKLFSFSQKTDQQKKNIPDHLREFVTQQDTSQYQPIDQAVWRYILRQLKVFLSAHAHSCYLNGLEKTGITVEEIPNIESIGKKLENFGWTAVPVSGFIPPTAFMELQSLGILPIASAMRSIEHILYTPAPDIVHEAAGHAPILVNPEFSSYLREYANVARKTIISSEDMALYEAIRELSDIKEHPDSTSEEIKKANEKLIHISKSISFSSEAALLGRMNWWTAEYGLIGSLNNPKIYGAGLLSSYGEARECLKDHVKKIPFNIDCIKYSYDITEPQPQLFVAESFSDLKRTLGELSVHLSFKKGGVFGLDQAIKAKTVNTLQLNSGLQVSGQITEYLTDRDGECIFFRLQGPTQLSLAYKELPGHSKKYHSQGYSSPIGFIKGYENCLSWASDKDLKAMKIIKNERVEIHFKSGIKVEGMLTDFLRTQRKELCLLCFTDCTVTYGDKILFMPEWGTFDMAIGSEIESVFAGPADRKNYGLTDSFIKKRVPTKTLSEKNQKLNEIYQAIREFRHKKSSDLDQLTDLFNSLERDFQTDWLARVELVELTHRLNEVEKIRKNVLESLEEIKKQKPENTGMIEDGLKLADQNL